MEKELIETLEEITRIKQQEFKQEVLASEYSFAEGN